MTRRLLGISAVLVLAVFALSMYLGHDSRIDEAEATGRRALRGLIDIEARCITAHAGPNTSVAPVEPSAVTVHIDRMASDLSRLEMAFMQLSSFCQRALDPARHTPIAGPMPDQQTGHDSHPELAEKVSDLETKTSNFEDQLGELRTELTTLSNKVEVRCCEPPQESQ
jgi:hypothetical protein